MIRVGGAAPSAGSDEALCVLEATLLGWLGLSAMRLSGGSQHLCLGLAWYAALCTVVILPGGLQ